VAKTDAETTTAPSPKAGETSGSEATVASVDLPPLVRPEDADSDGIPDDQDSCPKVAEDVDGFEDFNGCPEADDDGDGLADAVDRCRQEAETLNSWEDDDGCPDVVPESLAKVAGTIQGIVFDSGQATLRLESGPVLANVAAVLRQPENSSVLIVVEGHTDSRGTREANLKLSQRRAETVVQWLANNGIAKSRLSAVGHGPDRPVAANDTEAGRQKNRRITFVLKRAAAAP
jgi:outer membrane protein OmpA-like peptidoglycan-associated protein